MKRLTKFQHRVKVLMEVFRSSREIADAMRASETRVSEAMDRVDAWQKSQKPLSLTKNCQVFESRAG